MKFEEYWDLNEAKYLGSKHFNKIKQAAQDTWNYLSPSSEDYSWLKTDIPKHKNVLIKFKHSDGSTRHAVIIIGKDSYGNGDKMCVSDGIFRYELNHVKEILGWKDL